jgi:hypothetical protein
MIIIINEEEEYSSSCKNNNNNSIKKYNGHKSIDEHFEKINTYVNVPGCSLRPKCTRQNKPFIGINKEERKVVRRWPAVLRLFRPDLIV